MGVFETIVLVVLISLCAGLARTWIKHRAGNGALPAEQEARLARLEDRVRSLEAVVGDSSYELKQKFRDLEK